MMTAYPLPVAPAQAGAAVGAAQGRRRPPPARGRRLFHAFDLLKIELDGGRAAKDRHRYLDARLVEIEFLDDAVEARERTFEHLDLVADFVIDANLGLRTRRGLFLAVPDGRRLESGRASCGERGCQEW